MGETLPYDHHGSLTYQKLSHPFGDGFDLGEDETSLGKITTYKVGPYWVLVTNGGISCINGHSGYKPSTLSPIIMVQWKMAGYLQGDDPIGDTPIFH